MNHTSFTTFGFILLVEAKYSKYISYPNQILLRLRSIFQLIDLQIIFEFLILTLLMKNTQVVIQYIF